MKNKGSEFALEALDTRSYKDCLDYIEAHWDLLTVHTPKDRGLLIGLPHPYVCPSRAEFEEKMYYWDTYFINLGLLVSGRTELALGMVNNLLYLFERFGFIPQSNRFYHLGKSNPPFLTSMVGEVFGETQDISWLKRAVFVAQGEYENNWMGKYRLTDTGLSRYWEPTHTHEQAEDESGWDRTSRFYDRCLHINPVDLNCLLYKYEVDLGRFFQLLDQRAEARKWKKRSQQRRALVNKLMWDERAGFFFDFNTVTGKYTRAWTLAGFFPLWTGLATRDQAKKMRQGLKHFEHRGGLSTTRRVYRNKSGRQWDHPTGWPNLHWIVIKGLLDYGFRDDALRIELKWLNTCHAVFKKTGKLWEKYDVTRRCVSHIGRYETQWGFGWTNGVFAKILESPDALGKFSFGNK